MAGETEGKTHGQLFCSHKRRKVGGETEGKTHGQLFCSHKKRKVGGETEGKTHGQLFCSHKRRKVGGETEGKTHAQRFVHILRIIINSNASKCIENPYITLLYLWGFRAYVGLLLGSLKSSL